jgi:hypothetical protein
VSLRLQLRLERLTLLFVNIHKDDTRTFFQKQPRTGFPNTLGTSSDQANFAAETIGNFILDCH